MVLRCPSGFYVKLRSALSMATSYESLECYFRVLKASPCLVSLASGNSRSYQHHSPAGEGADAMVPR